MMRLVWSPVLERPIPEPYNFTSLSKSWDVVKPWGDQPKDPVVAGYMVACAPLATKEELYRAHDASYVNSVFTKESPNGFGNCSPEVLNHVLASNGVMLTAVEAALQNPQDVIVCPVSGFHHAHYAEAAGYCTFNGLLVALAAARVRRRVRQVLIIDGDAHYGDGTDDVLLKTAVSGVMNLTHRPSGPNALNPNIWEQTIRGLLTNQKWDLVMYQAGADCHVSDPYGAGYLSDADFQYRDEMIFKLCRVTKTPLVVNFAGGYNGEKTLALHRGTVKSAIAMYRSSAYDPQSHA